MLLFVTRSRILLNPYKLCLKKDLLAVYYETKANVLYICFIVCPCLAGDDAIGKLIEDFHQSDADQMHYRELADGVRHFKNEKEGREDMCEAVQKYAKERELGANISAVSNLMKNMKVTLEQALHILGIQGEDRTAIKKQLQK